MSVKSVKIKEPKGNLKQAEGGQHEYAAWDEGAYDRAGFGLGQFRTPPSEDMPAPAPEPQKRTKRV